MRKNGFFRLCGPRGGDSSRNPAVGHGSILQTVRWRKIKDKFDEKQFMRRVVVGPPNRIAKLIAVGLGSASGNKKGVLGVHFYICNFGLPRSEVIPLEVRSHSLDTGLMSIFYLLASLQVVFCEKLRLSAVSNTLHMLEFPGKRVNL